jgi:hypothetical protein
VQGGVRTRKPILINIRTNVLVGLVFLPSMALGKVRWGDPVPGNPQLGNNSLTHLVRHAAEVRDGQSRRARVGAAEAVVGRGLVSVWYHFGVMRWK